MTALSISSQPGEPLGAWFSPEQRTAFGAEQRFEFASFGDRVSGRCWLPARPATGLVLALHRLSRDKDDASVIEAARVWGAAGWMTAAIDLPLHGERHNAKLSRRAVVGSAAEGGADRALWMGLLAQAVRDLARALDAFAARGALADVACVAQGDAAPIALAHASLDARVRIVAAIGTPRALTIELGAQPTKTLVWIARPDDLVFARRAPGVTAPRDC